MYHTYAGVKRTGTGSEGAIGCAESHWGVFQYKNIYCHIFTHETDTYMCTCVGAKMTGTGSGWSEGAIGCAESHWGVFQHVYDEGFGRALILEDDVVSVCWALYWNVRWALLAQV